MTGDGQPESNVTVVSRVTAAVPGPCPAPTAAVMALFHYLVTSRDPRGRHSQLIWSSAGAECLSGWSRSSAQPRNVRPSSSALRALKIAARSITDVPAQRILQWAAPSSQSSGGRPPKHVHGDPHQYRGRGNGVTESVSSRRIDTYATWPILIITWPRKVNFEIWPQVRSRKWT